MGRSRKTRNESVTSCYASIQTLETKALFYLRRVVERVGDFLDNRQINSMNVQSTLDLLRVLLHEGLPAGVVRSDLHPALIVEMTDRGG